jgi:cellulose synthase/poly-beta-1,6-N-acetylglucosamine synthase-like glycosyltransferase
VVPVAPARPCAAVGRNAGWRLASAPFVLFLDGDTELVPGFVESALAAFADPQVAIVWGHRREMHPEASTYNRVLDLDWIYPAGDSEFCGGDAVVRRAVLQDVGGFDESLIAGEEPEMCRRIRARDLRILHIDVAMTRHDMAMTHFRQYWRRAVRAGHAYAEVAARFQATGIPLWQREVRHNAVMGAAVLGLVTAGAIASIALMSAWPIVTAFALLASLSLRAAYRARWKSSGTWTLVLYGMHSYFQHVPILVGQIGFRLDRRAGRRRGLIEYKAVQS